MQAFSLEEFFNLLDSNQITPYNIYNLDQDYQQFYSIDHYLKHPDDNLDKDQKLNILFQDIEVYTGNAGEFPKVNQAKYPISSITIYSTFEKIYKSYFLLQHSNASKFPEKTELNNLENYYKDELLKNGYLEENEDIKIQVFMSELDLIRACWSEIKKIDPIILSGWSSERFDLPYTYFRLSNLLNKNESEIGKILSQFGIIKLNKMGEEFLIAIPEYPVADLLYLYKPRDEAGLNYGDKQPSYSLDFIAEVELNLKKLEYKNSGMTLDTFYETDPVNFLMYNIVDVILVQKMNKKLKHIDSHNLLRRLMKTPFSKSLNGSAALYDTYVNYKLMEEGKFVRFGIVDETNSSISEDQLGSIYIPKSMKRTVKDISQQTYRAIIGRFPGAYVKQSKAQIINSKDNIIIDLDASLPPWEKIFIRRDNKIFWDNIGDYQFQENDETLTWNDKNETCWKKVLNKLTHYWKGKLIKITTETNKQITVTGNHSIFGIEQGKRVDTPYIIDAERLKIGDFVVGFKQSESISLEKIEKIEVSEYEGKVYDLSVEETERFFGGTGIGAHNSSLYPSI